MKLFGCALAFAAALTAAEASAQATDGLELGLQAFAYDYEETFEGGSVGDEGRFGGFTVEYGRRLGRLSFDARFRYGEGRVDYSASDGARLDDVQQSSGQLELLAGWPLAASPTLTVTPYLGLGSRVLLDESGGRETAEGLQGYDREVAYAYVPLGAAVRFARQNGGALVLHGQVNLLAGGHVESDFRPLDPGAPLLETELDGGHGLEFGASLQTPFRGGRIGFGPFIRYWDIDPSNSVVFRDEDLGVIEFFEPANRTLELGVKLTYGF